MPWRIGKDTDTVKVYVPREQKKRWEKAAISKGFFRTGDGRKKAKLSEFIKTQITLMVNGGEDLGWTSPPESEKYRAQIRNLEEEIKRQQEENAAMKRREVGVSENRVIERLSENEDKTFDQLVQGLIDTEAEATYEALQQLILKKVVTYGKSRDSFRLRGR